MNFILGAKRWFNVLRSCVCISAAGENRLSLRQLIDFDGKQLFIFFK